LKKAVLIKRKDALSPKNRLVGAYIYGSRGISPRNILIGSEFYKNNEVVLMRTPSLHEKIRKLLKTLII